MIFSPNKKDTRKIINPTEQNINIEYIKSKKEKENSLILLKNISNGRSINKIKDKIINDIE